MFTMVPTKEADKKNAGVKKKPMCAPLQLIQAIQPKPNSAPLTIKLPKNCFTVQPQVAPQVQPTILIPIETFQQIIPNSQIIPLPKQSGVVDVAASAIKQAQPAEAPTNLKAAELKEIAPNFTDLERYVEGSTADIPQLWSSKDSATEKKKDCSDLTDLSQLIAVNSPTSPEEDQYMNPGPPEFEDFPPELTFPKGKDMTPELAAKIAQTDVKDVLDIIVRQNRLFCCDHCEMYFPSYGTYILHKSCHANDDPLRCHFCGVLHTDQHEFLTHFVHCARPQQQ